MAQETVRTPGGAEASVKQCLLKGVALRSRQRLQQLPACGSAAAHRAAGSKGL